MVSRSPWRSTRILETVDERQTTRQFLQRNFNNTTSPRPVLLDEETKAAIRERYAAENRELLAKYQGPERSDQDGRQESSPQVSMPPEVSRRNPRPGGRSHRA